MKPSIRRDQVAGMNIHYKNYSLDYFLNAQQSIGFTSIALWGGPPHFWLDYVTYSDCKMLRNKIQSMGLNIVGFVAASVLYRYQYCLFEPEYRERSFHYFSNGIKAAAELGSKSLHINSGWGYKTENREEAWKRSRDMLFRLANVAQQEGIVLSMESLRPDETGLVTTLQDAKRMFAEINHSSFKIMLDTNPMGVANETIWQWFETFDQDIVNIHFVDGNPFGHLIWGDGTFPLEDMVTCLNTYNFEGYLCQEITDARYFNDPVAADGQNMKTLSRYFI
ncbi:sugar phosphate isomerase/epimerase family protein [Neobacillus niacini]|uniref:sugar phosphate isomerase/epimerase family protein n=1 Tax=Neobacillus niacini TaxID=86668 RepID=UPI0030001B09